MENLDPKIWEKNIKLLTERWPELANLIQKDNCGSCQLRLLNCRSGDKSCQVKAEDGSWITLHSIYNPWQEAERIVRHLQLQGGKILILLGFGLGYLPQVLAKSIPKEQPMVVVEKEPQLLKTALQCLDLSAFLSLPNLSLLVGKRPAWMLKQIGKIQLKYCLQDFDVIEHPPTLKAFPSFYQPILRESRRFCRSELRKKVFYPKLCSETLRVLVFNSRYFILWECVRALKSLGHQVELLSVPSPHPQEGNEKNGDKFIEALLTKIALFRPDFIFTVNHLGFDEEGKLTELLTRLQIPIVSWYVDSPSYILGKYSGKERVGSSRYPLPENYQKHISPLLYLFVWERHYVEKLNKLGFHNVYHLPLAADPEIFRKVSPHSSLLDGYRCDVSFVGNSMVKAVEKWSRKYPHTRATEKIAKLAISMQKKSHSTPMEEILRRIETEYDFPLTLSNNGDLLGFESALVLKCTQEYRKELVEALEEFGINVYGDEGWFSLISPEKIALFPPLDYYTQLPLLYNASKINLNATSFQMNTALNQRVFDVAACEGFLLTDHQPDMDELFEVDSEAVCYHDKEELKELVRFYLPRPQLRQVIASRARRRVLAEHTYLHRMKRIISIIRREIS